MLSSIASNWRLSRNTPTLRDRCLVFLLGINAGLGTHRTTARRAFPWLIGRFDDHGLVKVALTAFGRTILLSMRSGNAADYLVAGELIHGGYDVPEFTPSLIVDAGANIGTFALAASARFPDVPVVCYEPEEGNFELLGRNMDSNNVKGKRIKKGVWSETTTLFFQPVESYTGFLSSANSGIKVECELPEIVEDTWLKIDVEGAEYEVLPALFRSGRKPRFISMEIHHRKSKGDELISLARSQGYIVSGPLDADSDCIVVSMARV